MTIDFDKVHPRPAHANGFTVVAYKKDGKGLITAGADAIVRVFDTAKSQRDKSSENVFEHAEGVLSIAVHNDTFATAGEDGAVSVFRCSNNQFEKYLVRSLVPVRCLAYSANGAKIAVAADEETIRIVLVRDIKNIVQLVGHNKSVKCVAFDPVGDYLVSSGCEGDVRIWDTQPVSGAPQCVKTLSGVIRSTLADSHLLGTVAWKPDGSCIAFPGVNNDICIYQRHLWTKSFSLENGHTDDVVTFAWSPNGRYLCSAGADKQLIIWDVKSRKVLLKYTNTDEVSGISWHPTENQLAFVDRQGQLFVWDDPIDLSVPGSQHPASTINDVNSELDRLLAGDIDMDPAPQQPQQRSKDKPRRPAPKPAILDEAEDDETQQCEEEEEEGEDLEDPDVDMFSERDDFVIDDDGAGYAEAFMTEEDTAGAGAQRGYYGRASARGPQYKITPHPRIQPGATQFRRMDISDSSKPREGERRYMAFSMFGIVYTIFQDTHSVVNVEFHDQSSHRNFHFTDYNNYTLAAIGENGVVFGVEGGAAKPTEEEDKEPSTASIIYYRPLSNWADSSEWTVRLPEGEDVLSVAINNGHVIAATSAGYIRIFTITGIQTHLFKLENIVAIAGGGNLAMFVYSVGTGFNDEYNLEFMIMDTDTRDILQKDKLPLQKGTQLTWIGFSDSMQAAMCDSNNVLSVLYQQRKMNQSTWVPIFDGRIVASQKNRKERYWPIGLLRDRLMCLVLKKSNGEPYFPRPPVSDIELQMPTLNTESEVGRLEEAHLRELVVSTHERDEAAASGLEDELYAELRKAEIDMDKTLLQLIRIACRADKHQRALDLTYALHMTKSVDGAIKIASHHGLASLAEKMMQVKEDKLMAESRATKRRADGEVDDLLASSKRLRL